MQVGNYLNGLRKVYPRSTDYKFIYVSEAVFQAEHRGVVVYYLVQDRDTGQYKIWPFGFNRREPKTVEGWRSFLEGEGYMIFTTAVLPAYNNKNGTMFGFDSLLAWRVRDEISQRHTSATPGKRKAKSPRGK